MNQLCSLLLRRSWSTAGERDRGKNKLPMKVEDCKSWDQQSGECEQPWVPGDGCEESRAFTGQALAHVAHTHCKSGIAHQGVGGRTGLQVWLLFPFKLGSERTIGETREPLFAPLRHIVMTDSRGCPAEMNTAM